MTRPDFVPFPKIVRLLRDAIITEKIDGTNASITITEDGDIFPASRTRWLAIGDDNYGFAAWVEANRQDLLLLGPGQHFGEWWGKGIQRGYNLAERRFSLFNTTRWAEETSRPTCCHVVPVLGEGLFNTMDVAHALHTLHMCGSIAAPGYMNPEGVVVFHTAGNKPFKVTLDNDGFPKSKFTAPQINVTEEQAA